MVKRLKVIVSLLIILGMFTSVVVSNQRDLHEAENVFEDVAESVLILENIEGGHGTGFVTDAGNGQQVIVTNDHVCDSPAPIFKISHRSGDKIRSQIQMPTTILKRYDEHDLCVMVVPPGLKVKSLPLADDAYLDSKIYIIGYPHLPLLSSAEGYIRGALNVEIESPIPIDQCVSKKHIKKTVPIKQKNGTIKNEERCFFSAAFVFTDALGEYGASGSPVLNGDGEVVGVMSMINGAARPFAHIVPLSHLKKFLSSI